MGEAEGGQRRDGRGHGKVGEMGGQAMRWSEEGGGEDPKC